MLLVPRDVVLFTCFLDILRWQRTSWPSTISSHSPKSSRLTCAVRDVIPLGRRRVEIENGRGLADEGDFIKAVLTRLTGRSTFPNVILHGESIGGSDGIAALHKDGQLRQLFENAGLMV